ncbi:MAG: AAA family ATPase [Phycisphaerae bacterium]
MKIKELKIEGYRSLKDVAWRPGDLNVLIGPNGGGKSNLLRVLQLLNASARKGLGKHVRNEGGMEPMVWDGRAGQVSISVETLQPDAKGDVGACLTYTFRLDRIGSTGSYSVGAEELTTYGPAGTGTRRVVARSLARIGLNAVVYDAAQHGVRIPGEEVPEEETLLSIATGPFVANAVVKDFQAQLASWGVYAGFGADAESPARKSAVARFDQRLEPNGENLVPVLHTLYTGNRDFQRDVDDALHAAFGADFEELVFAPEADQRIQLRVGWSSLSRKQSAADLSDGTLRFLYLLAILANPNPPPLIAIDEPENGLHPSMQRIVAELAADAATRSQVVLTTHSPEFLDAFDDVVPTTSVVEWAEGQTRITNLSGDALKAWLERYALGEILRTNEAAIMEKEEAP